MNPSKAKRYFNNLGYSVTYDKVESSEEEKNNMQEEIDTEIIPWINEFIMDANPYHLLKKTFYQYINKRKTSSSSSTASARINLVTFRSHTRCYLYYLR